MHGGVLLQHLHSCIDVHLNVLKIRERGVLVIRVLHSYKKKRVRLLSSWMERGGKPRTREDGLAASCGLAAGFVFPASGPWKW